MNFWGSAGKQHTHIDLLLSQNRLNRDWSWTFEMQDVMLILRSSLAWRSIITTLWQAALWICVI
jgi:hypothetical protein